MGEGKLPGYKNGAYHQGCLCNKLVLGSPERSAWPAGSQREPEEHVGGKRCPAKEITTNGTEEQTWRNESAPIVCNLFSKSS